MSGKECVFDFLHTKSTLPGPILGGRYTLVPGERLNGIQEVSGSIPLLSTISRRAAFKNPFPKGNGFLFYRELSPTNSSVSLKHPLQMPNNAARYFIWDRCPLFLQKRTVNTCFQKRPMRTTDGQMEAYLFGHRHIRAGRVRSVPAYIL